MKRIRLKDLNPARIWSALGMNIQVLILMVKGALAPTIVIAMQQSLSVAKVGGNYSYFAVIASIISAPTMPRAKFMKIMLFNVLATCVAASSSCLGVFCAVRARQHTTPANASSLVVNGYNSSAAAVSGIWFIFDIWISNTIRTFRPTELTFPMILAGIFSAVIMTSAPRFITLASALGTVKQLLQAVLLGFAIATGVSLFIVPVTSRRKALSGLKPYHGAVKSLLDAQVAFVRSSQVEGPWNITRRQTLSRWATRTTTGVSRQKTGESTERKQPPLTPYESKAQQLKTAMGKLNGICSQVHAEMYYAKQEIVWGKLTSEDFEAVFSLLRALLVPLSGIGMLPEIFRKLSKPIPQGVFGLGGDLLGQDAMRHPRRSSIESIETLRDELNQEHFIEPLCQRLEDAAELVSAGLQHAFVTLGIVRAGGFTKRIQRRKFSVKDEEATGSTTPPGRPGFTERFDLRLREFYAARKELPERWVSLNAFAPVEDQYQTGEQPPDEREIRKEFFVILFIGHLQDVLLQATLDFVKFADSKVDDGTMKRRRFVFPKREYVKGWLSLGQSEEETETENLRPQLFEQNTETTTPSKRSDPLKTRYADPEHLPPTNIWQKSGNILRHISHFLGSNESLFGFRVAVGSFSVAILAYLRQTQDFYLKQRINWAVIVLIIGMTPTSGSFIFGLMGRVVATIASVALAFAVWYIVAGQTAGVIVFTFVGNLIQYYFYVKFPRFLPASTIALITFNQIIAYELQVRVLGVAFSTSTGMRYFPIYLFGPYRLVTVLAACGISFFWIIFPYPTSARSQLRKVLGRSLFVLANFYSCMHTAIHVWMHQEQGNPNDEQSPAKLLERARNKLFAEEMALLSTLRTHSQFTVYEPTIGGRFPKETYDSISSEIQTILASMDLMAQATRNLENMSVTQSPDENQEHINEPATSGDTWIRYLSEAARSPDFHPHLTTSVLCHLSAAVSSGLSLPPYLSPPHPFPLARRLRRMNEGLMDIRYIEDPAFSAFVSIEVLSSMVSSSLKKLVSDVKLLVGELNFDVYVRYHRQKVQESARPSTEGSRDNTAEGAAA